MIAAGTLNRRVTLLQRLDTRDAVGGAVPTWNTIATVWAYARAITGREQFAAGRIDPTNDIIFTLRFRTDVSVDWRVGWDGMVFDIMAIAEIGYREGIALTTRARAQ